MWSAHGRAVTDSESVWKKSDALVDNRGGTGYFDGMSRTSFVLSIGACLLLPAGLLAQKTFPSPSVNLHDVKFNVTGPPPPEAGKYTDVDGRRFVRVDQTPTRVNSLVFSPDGKLLAAGKDYGRLVVWDVPSGQVVRTIDTGLGKIFWIAISPDDQFAAASGLRPKIQLWRIPDGKLVSTFDTEANGVSRLIYTRNPNLLIVGSGWTRMYDQARQLVASISTYLLDTTTGKHVIDLPDEMGPVLSTDGSTLLTTKGSGIVLRNTRDWTTQRTLPKLTGFEQPVFLDSAQGLFLFEDATDNHLFVAARASDGQMPPEAKLANLPRTQTALFGSSDFAAIDPHTGLVFGHSGGQLWALDLKTGNTCLSPRLFSNSGALSPDGSLLAGAIDSETPTDNQKKAGVDIWKTAALANACHMQ